MTPQQLHCDLEKDIVKSYGFDEHKDFNTQKQLIHSKLIELLGIPEKKNKSKTNY